MARIYTIYQVVGTQAVYTHDGTQFVELTGESYPYIRYKEQIELKVQWLNSQDLEDIYTGFQGTDITTTAAVDNDWIPYTVCSLGNDLSGAITSVTLTGLDSTPTSTGEFLLINAANEQETVAYTSFVSNGADSYTFVVNFTLVNTYVTGDNVRYKDTPIIKTFTADTALKNEGLISYNLDAYNEVYQNEVLGTNAISDCLFEAQVYSGNELTFVSQFTFLCFNIMDDDGAIPPPVDGNDYITRGEAEALVANKLSKDLTSYPLDESLSDTDLIYLFSSNVSNNTTLALLKAYVLSGDAGGDMMKATYDPNNVESDAFDMDNMAEGTDNKLFTEANQTKLNKVPDYLGTFETFTANDNTSTYIVVGDYAASRVITIDLWFTDNTNYVATEIDIVHDNSACNLNIVRHSQAVDIAGVTFSADISGNDIRLIITSTGTGTAVNGKYTITNKLPV